MPPLHNAKQCTPTNPCCINNLNNTNNLAIVAGGRHSVAGSSNSNNSSNNSNNKSNNKSKSSATRQSSQKLTSHSRNHLLFLDSIPEYTSFHDIHLTLYPERWCVLLAFCLLSMSSSWMWITWSPLAYLVAEAWNVPDSYVDDLSGIYMYVYVLGSFVSLYLVVNHWGLYKGLAVGATFNMVGALVRYYFAHDYNMVYIGTLLCAVAQTFTLSTPPLIAASWFGETERATATALGVLANQMGTALGLGMTSFIDFTSLPLDGNLNGNVTVSMADVDVTKLALHWPRLERYLHFQLWISVTAFILVLSFVSDRPPTPPSAHAAIFHSGGPSAFVDAERSTSSLEKDVEKVDEGSPLINDKSSTGQSRSVQNLSLTYGESIRFFLYHPRHLLFLMCFALTVGVFYTIPTFIAQLVPTTWALKSSGFLGMGFQLVGAIGSLSAGRVVDLTQQHKLVAMAVLCASFLSTLFLAFTLDDAETRILDESSWRWVVSLVLGVLGSGCSLAAWNSVGLEYGANLAYPANEAAVAGILEAAAELAAFGLVELGGWWLDGGGKSTYMLILAFLVWLSMMVFVCTPNELHHDPPRR
jgi:MFS transporter, FLVCR family, feline leukemia virus subgroup C receptor-related protein